MSAKMLPERPPILIKVSNWEENKSVDASSKSDFCTADILLSLFLKFWLSLLKFLGKITNPQNEF